MSQKLKEQIQLLRIIRSVIMENIESSWNILMVINFKILVNKTIALKNFKINNHQYPLCPPYLFTGVCWYAGPFVTSIILATLYYIED